MFGHCESDAGGRGNLLWLVRFPFSRLCERELNLAFYLPLERALQSVVA